MSDKKNNNLLLRYAGMGAQFAVGIGLGIYLGIKLDEWVQWSFPLFVWLLPMIFIIGMLVRIIIDTSNTRK